MKKSLTLEKDDLSLINQYARKELSESEIYVFNVTLCDNNIDRDYECFSKDSLEKLSKLFVGKTGIFDHNMRASSQSARIFKTWVEGVEGKTTSDGQPYFRLRAGAYMIRTEENKALIEEIEGGIKKEVSIGCSVEKEICSVCSKDRRVHRCEHIKGKSYKGKLCYGILDQPTDAYEWSFVAVPSQREAGVTKAFEEKRGESVAKVFKTASTSTSFSEEELELITGYIQSLEGYRQDAMLFRKTLLDSIEKYTLIAMPFVKTKDFISGLEAAETKKLLEIKKDLEKQVSSLVPPAVQLKPTASETKIDNTAYTI